VTCYAVIAGQPAAIPGISPDPIVVVSVDGDEWDAVSPDGDWVDAMFDMAVGSEDLDFESEVGLLGYLIRGNSYYRVIGPIDFDGPIEAAWPVLAERYFRSQDVVVASRDTDRR
jgi:hypothetical protein